MITILLLKTFELLHLSKASWCVRHFSTILVLPWSWPRSCWNTNSFWQEPCKLTPDNYLWNFPKDRLQPWQILYTSGKAQRRQLFILVLPVSGMPSGYRPFSDPDTPCQEETCVENVLWGIAPQSWCLPFEMSLISGYTPNSSDSADFYPPPNFSERNRTFPCIYSWRQVDCMSISKAATWKINCNWQET